MEINILLILEIFAGMLVLVPLSGLLIHALQQILARLKVEKKLAVFIVIGFVTALPELIIGMAAIFIDMPELALGNAIGTSIVLMTLIAGIVAIYNRDFKTNELLSHKLLSFLSILIVVLLILAADGELSSTDGVLLLIGYGLYLYNLITNADKYTAAKVALSKPRNLFTNASVITASLIVMTAAAFWVVGEAEVLIIVSGLPALFVGISLLAPMGTMPELIFELELNSRQKSTLTLAEIFTSLVTTSTLVVGLVALIKPIKISSPQIFSYNAFILVGVILLFNYFIRSRNTLSSREGFVLILCYFIFLFGNFALLSF